MLLLVPVMLATLPYAAASLRDRERADAKVLLGVRVQRLAPSPLDIVRKTSDPGLLAWWAQAHRDSRVRQKALERLTDEAVLARRAQADPDPRVREVAHSRLGGPTGEVAQRAAEAGERRLLAEPSDEALADLAQQDPDLWVRVRAASRIRDQARLEALARLDPEPEVLAACLDNLRSAGVLEAILRGQAPPLVRAAALRQAAATGAANWPLVRQRAIDPLEPLSVRIAAASVLAHGEHDLALGLGCGRGDAAACRKLVELAEQEPESLRWLDAAHLEQLARRAVKPYVRLAAADLLPEPQRLAALLALRADSPSEARAVETRVQDPGLLESWARAGSEVALDRVADPETLRDIALHERLAGDVARSVVRRVLPGPELEELARHAVSADVREAAVERIDDAQALVEVARNAPGSSVSGRALRRLGQDELEQVARHDPSRELRLAAIGLLERAEALVALVRGEGPAYERIRALSRLEGPIVWSTATEDRDVVVRRAAVERLGDRALSIAESETQPLALRLAAVRQLRDQEALARLVRGAGPGLVRGAAVARLAALGAWPTLSELESQVEDAPVRAALQRRVGHTFSRRLPRDPECLAGLAGGVEQCNDVSTGACAHLVELAVSCPVPELQIVANVGDTTALARIARTAASWASRLAAADRIAELPLQRALYEELLADDDGSDTTAAVVDRLDDRALLAGLAEGHPNPGVRVAALRRVPDPQFLAKLALSADDGARSLAARRVTDVDVLEQVARLDPDDSVRSTALATCQDPRIAAATVRQAHEPALRRRAAERLADDVLVEIARLGTSRGRVTALTVLAERHSHLPEAAVLRSDLAWHEADPEVRLAAVAGLSDPEMVAALASRHPDPAVRIAALQLDPSLARGVALDEAQPLGVRLSALARLEAAETLEQLAGESGMLAVRAAALERLAAIGARSSLSRLATTAQEPAIRELALSRAPNDAGLAASAAGREHLDRRHAEQELASRRYVPLWSGLGADYSPRGGWTFNAPLAVPLGSGGPGVAGVLARPDLGLTGAGLDVGVFGTFVTGLGLGDIGVGVPVPLLGLGGGLGLVRSWKEQDGLGRGTFWGPRVEARFLELFRVSYARLRPTSGGEAFTQWTFGAQVPFAFKQLRVR